MNECISGVNKNPSQQIEEVADSSDCDSVTIARLAESPKVILSMRPFTDRLEGPFHMYVQADEQLRHLFHNCNLYFESGVDPFGDEYGIILHRIYPATLLVTDKRLTLVYKNDDQRRVILTRYEEITRFKTGIFGTTGIKVWSNNTFKVQWDNLGYEKAGKKALRYIKDRIQEGEKFEDIWTEDDSFQSAREILGEQLYKIKEIAMRADLEFVAGYAVAGAKIGARRGHYGAALGFVLGGGYGLWKDISKEAKNESSAADIDPKQTAQTIISWKRAGEKIGGKEMSLASAAIGAALSIESQTNDRSLTTLLANIDIEWVAAQIEDKSEDELILDVSYDEIETYTRQIGDLLDDDFFETLEKGF